VPAKAPAQVPAQVPEPPAHKAPGKRERPSPTQQACKQEPEADQQEEAFGAEAAAWRVARAEQFLAEAEAARLAQEARVEEAKRSLDSAKSALRKLEESPAKRRKAGAVAAAPRPRRGGGSRPLGPVLVE